MPLIKLPRKKLISINRRSITIDLPDNSHKYKVKIDFDKIKKAKGILKYRKLNGVKAQRKLRDEWS